MKSEAKTPSLIVWVFTIIISALFLLPFHFFLVRPGYFIYYNYINENISSFFNNGSHKEKVIVLGNSRTYFGLPYYFDKTNPSFDFLRITHGRFTFYEFIPIVEELLKYDNALILIQSDMFLYEKINPDKKSEFIKYFIFDHEQLIKNIPSLRSNSKYDKSDAMELLDEKMGIQENLYFLLAISKLRPELVNQFYSLLEKAKLKKIKFILLDIPRVSELDSKLKTSVHLKEYYEFIESGSPNKDFIHLSILNEIPDSLFIDNAHLNSAGRKLFSETFFQKIDSVAKGNL